jgi:hypothetical protein
MAEYRLTRLPDSFRITTALLAMLGALAGIGTAGWELAETGFSAASAALLMFGGLLVALAVRVFRGARLVSDDTAKRAELALGRPFVNPALTTLAPILYLALCADYFRAAPVSVSAPATLVSCLILAALVAATAWPPSRSLGALLLPFAVLGGIGGLCVALVRHTPAGPAAAIGSLSGAVLALALRGAMAARWR